MQTLRGRARRLLIAILLAVTALTGGSFSLSSGPASADTSAVVLTGILRGTDGALLPDAPVSLFVLAEDPASNGILNVEVDSTTTNEAGEFEVVDNGMDMTPYIGVGGSVTLEISSLTHTDGLVYDFSAVPPTTSSPGWVLSGIPGFDSGDPVGKRTSARLTFRSGRGLVHAGLRRPGGQLAALTGGSSNTMTAPAGESGEDTEESYNDGQPPDVPKTGGTIRPGGGTYCETPTQWQSTHDFKTNLMPVRYMKTLGRSSSDYLWDTTSKTQIGIGFNYDGDKYQAGFGYSRTQSTSIGIHPSIPNNSEVIFKVRWELERMREWCYVTAVTRFPLDIWKWVPTRMTGGNSKTATTATINGCTIEDTFASPTWITRTGSVRYDGWASIAGIKISTIQENTSSHKFTIDPDNDVDRTRYCGQGDYPLYANIAKEIPPS
jgi:hypothetical protein